MQLRAEAQAPKLSSLQISAMLDEVVTAKGTIARGQQLVSELGCAACHTVSASETPKGPFLGGIRAIMNRRQIAEAILQPDKSIAQGFATYQIELRDGSAVAGFVVREAADALTLRNLAAQETRIPVASIARRTPLASRSCPPASRPGLTLREFASLLDYLESLSK